MTCLARPLLPKTKSKQQKVGKKLITKQMIDRINALAQKQRTEGLTEAEKKEQQKLRGQYLAAIRTQLKTQLDAIEIVEPDDPRLKNQHRTRHRHQH